MTDSQPGEVWLIAFGGLEGFLGSRVIRTSSSVVADRLLTRGVWFLPRSTTMRTGDSLLFYENGRGVVASARLGAIVAVSQGDSQTLMQFGVSDFFRFRLELSDIVRFGHHVALAPLLDKLNFISNRRYWGQSLRSTPRKIPISDFQVILEAAEG
jgi:hypothetical protein